MAASLRALLVPQRNSLFISSTTPPFYLSIAFCSLLLLLSLFDLFPFSAIDAHL